MTQTTADLRSAEPPELGQLIEVRGLRCVVSNIEQSVLPTESLPHGLDRPQHLLTLSSVEDDAMGEELQVIWELEPGARVLNGTNLPEVEHFDAPARLDAFLDAVRWGAASSADVRALQAPFRSGVDIEDYQLDPVVRALQVPLHLVLLRPLRLFEQVETSRTSAGNWIRRAQIDLDFRRATCLLRR